MLIGNANYDGPADLPRDIPLFPLSGALLLPRCLLPLVVFEPRYIAMVDAALSGNRLIGIIQPRLDSGETVDDGGTPLQRIGAVGRITSWSETGDGRYQIVLSGIARFVLEEEVTTGTPYRVGRVRADFPIDFEVRAGEAAVNRDELIAVFGAYLNANDLETDWDSIDKASTESLVNALSMMSPFGPREKQALLEAADLKTRAETLVAMTEMELVRNAAGDDDSPVLN
jgi:Lon protease-like protein